MKPSGTQTRNPFMDGDHNFGIDDHWVFYAPETEDEVMGAKHPVHVVFLVNHSPQRKCRWMEAMFEKKKCKTHGKRVGGGFYIPRQECRRFRTTEEGGSVRPQCPRGRTKDGANIF